MIAQFNRFEIEMTKAVAASCSHQGSCDDDVEYYSGKIRRNKKRVTPENLRAELEDYGAWDDDELADDAANWRRIIWIAAGDIIEGK